MTRQITGRIGVVTLVLLALTFLGAKLPSAKTSAYRARNNETALKQDEQSFDQTRALENLRKSIAGRETKPAEEVFRNIQMLKGMPAARLLRVMELGYAKSLGVNCTHCHVVDHWEKEDKPTKQVAREIAAMVAGINNEYLKKIKNLKSPSPIINCTTCHRGQTKPALNLPESAPKP
jgi:Photosynthetic reaction centre cytochrome C subunit